MNDDLPEHPDPDYPDQDSFDVDSFLGSGHEIEPGLDAHSDLVEHANLVEHADYDAPPFEDSYVDAADVPDHGVPVTGDDEAEPDDAPRLEASVTPTDGLDWADPGLLGDVPVPAVAMPRAPAAELLADLQAMGDGDETWESAARSDDPAVRALAAHWHPDA